MNDSRPIRPASGWIRRHDRSRLVVQGPERSAFLHNLTTQNVNGLAPGDGAEAFVTSPQGKTLAFVSIHAEPDRLWLRSDAGLADRIGAHLSKYGLFNDATWSDVGPSTREWHVCGPEAESILKAGGCLPGTSGTPLGIERTSFAGVPVAVIPESPVGGNGWTLIADEPVSAELERALMGSSAVEIDPAAWESWRIEAGTLVDGVDVSPENLPQELDRDSRTISFHKGCYLGQETVARLDALGHVNRILRGFLLAAGPVPNPGATLIGPDGKAVGKITSSAGSPNRSGPIALGFVRTRFAEPGTILRVEATGPDAQTATVATLPLTIGPDGD